MISNNHKKSGCGHAEQIVSYIYGETGADENRLFEAHLESCSFCADELEAFSGVKFSLDNWKLTEFAGLKTPEIVIPYEKNGAAGNQTEIASLSDSWLTGLRNLISLSPAWSTAAASFAILAVCAVIALMTFDRGNENDVADGNKTPKPVFAPTAEKTPERSNANVDRSPDKNTNPLAEPKTADPEFTAAPDPKNKRAVKASNNERRKQKAETADFPKPVEPKRDNKNKPEVPPKIFEDDEEDDTLRLAELFEEIDTKE